MSERAFDRTEHLRHAAHGIRVLYAVAVLMIAVNRAVGE
jgi:hypothetical protein